MYIVITPQEAIGPVCRESHLLPLITSRLFYGWVSIKSKTLLSLNGRNIRKTLHPTLFSKFKRLHFAQRRNYYIILGGLIPKDNHKYVWKCSKDIKCVVLCYFHFFRGVLLWGPFVIMIYKMCATDILRFVIIFIVFLAQFSLGIIMISGNCVKVKVKVTNGMSLIVRS